MWQRVKEPSTWAGIGLAGLTYLQQTNDWKGALVAILSAFASIALPESKK